LSPRVTMSRGAMTVAKPQPVPDSLGT
jgi:hypothetical protein